MGVGRERWKMVYSKKEKKREESGIVNKRCLKTRWWNLKGKRATTFTNKVTDGANWNLKGEAAAIWSKMADNIRTTK